MENKSSTCHMTSEQRLIDANEALRMIKDSQEDNPFLNIRGQGEIWRGAHDNAIDCVNTCPTVDAVEVVHGRWIYKWDADRDPKKLFVRIVCSECNLHTGQKSNYCPNCGAKMDGGNEDV